MTSLGDNAYCTRLIARESIKVNGHIESTHKLIGLDSKNKAELHQNGSIFFLKYGHVERISAIETVDGSPVVTVDFNSAHGMQVGDTFHIGNTTADMNGIPANKIEGTHVVTVMSDIVAFSFNCGVNATSSGYTAAVTPLMRIDRYKYIDLSASNSSWTNSTTYPIASHINTHTHG